MDGLGTPDQIADRIQELGHNRIGITDHGTTYSHVPYSTVFPKLGITPIFGIEAYVVDDISERTRFQESLGVNAIPHITILASNWTGYQNLVRLNKKAWTEGFYHKPRIDWQLLRDHQGGLIVLSGCAGGYPTRLLTFDPIGVLGTNGTPTLEYPQINPESYQRTLDFFTQRRNEIEHFYVELVPSPGLDISHATADALFNISNQLQIPAVLTSDAHFPRPDDHLYQDILLCAGMGKRLSDPNRLSLADYYYYCDRETLLARAKEVCETTHESHLNQALDNTVILANMCDVQLPKGKRVAFPDIPANMTSSHVLWKWMREGLEARGVAQNQTYLDRAQREFTTLDKKNFCDYILAIGDVVRWVKDQGGLVMVRGSAGGCLLLWLIGASETDPIVHDLSFERFYDDNRPDPPDVDVDFEQGWRDRAIDYVFEKYGQDYCAQVAALSRLTAKAALQDTAKVLGIPRAQYVRLSNALNSKIDDVESQYKTFKDPAIMEVLEKHPQLRAYEKLIGQYRHSSTHAAGVIVSSIPLADIIGIVTGHSDRSRLIATVDKHGAAELDLLKMDFLSVSALDTIARAATSARGDVKWLYDLPLDDPEALLLARCGYLSEIFQLDGTSAARVAREIQVSSFEDLVAASALCRPGPADWVATYKENKLVVGKFDQYLKSMNPKAADIVAKTYGIILYQEQVMRFAREVAGLDWPDVHKIRKGAAASAGSTFMDTYQDKFINGAKQTSGLSDVEARHWWESILSHGGYSFNRAHCVTYGIIGYWDLYLKAHYPDHFYQSAMTGASEYGMKRLVGEFRSRDGQVQLFDWQNPIEDFHVANHIMTGSVLGLKGVGPKSAEKIANRAPYETPADFYKALPKQVTAKLAKAAERNWDPCILLPLAQWFPVTSFGPGDEAMAQNYSRVTVAQITALPMIDGTINLVGYVSFKSDEEDRLSLVLEDPTGAIFCRVAARRVKEMGPAWREICVGDFVAIAGWWSGEALFVSASKVLRRDCVE